MYIRLKELLKEKGLSGKDLANKLNVSTNTISFIATGKTQPRLELLEKIANVLDVDIKDLFISTKETEPIHLIIKNELEVFDNIDALKKHVETL